MLYKPYDEKKLETRVKQIIAEKGDGEMDFWLALARWDYLIKDFVDCVNMLYKKGEIELRDGRIILKNAKSFEKLEDRTCKICKGRGIIADTELLKKFRKIIKKRPETTEKYFQGNMDEESAVSKVYFIHARESIANKKFAIIGDDDYFSIALGLTKMPAKIYVLEIDERIGKFIERVSADEGLDIEFINYNVEDPLPKELRKKCDIFVSEPIETLSGFLAFFSRGAGAIKENGSGYIGLTNLECSLKKWHKIEKEIIKSGFVITDIKNRFSFYPMEYPEDRVYVEQILKAMDFKIDMPKSDKIWYFSHLMRVEAIEKIRPPFKENVRIKIDVFDPEEDFTFPGSIKIF